jgi:drug/metabolite transporter (DMT)-like permease
MPASAHKLVLDSSGSQGRIFPPWWVALLLATLMAVGGHLLIKSGLNSIDGAALRGSLWMRLGVELSQVAVLGGLLIYGLGTLFWMISLAQQELSFLYPLTSVNYLLIVVLSALVFHERVTLRRGAGVILIAAGVVLMNRVSSRGRR